MESRFLKMLRNQQIVNYLTKLIWESPFLYWSVTYVNEAYLRRVLNDFFSTMLVGLIKVWISKIRFSVQILLW